MLLLARGGGEVHAIREERRTGVLKIFASELGTFGQLVQQQRFVEYLNQGGVECPRAVRGRAGEFVGVLASGRYAVFYESGRGRSINGYSVGHIKRLGSQVARYHQIGQAYGEPYPRLNPDWLILGPTRAVLRGLQRHGHDPRKFLQAVKRIDVDLHPTHEATSGVFHGDLHYSNTLWHGMNPCLIDFDHSRWGPVVFDLAVICLLANARANHHLNLQTHFLQSYERESHLTAADFRLLPSLMAAFHLFVLGHHCRYQNSRYPRATSDFVSANTATLESYGTPESIYTVDGPPHDILDGALNNDRSKNSHDIRHPTTTGDAALS